LRDQRLVGLVEPGQVQGGSGRGIGEEPVVGRLGEPVEHAQQQAASAGSCARTADPS
jgi:hypothetical protein